MLFDFSECTYFPNIPTKRLREECVCMSVLERAPNATLILSNRKDAELPQCSCTSLKAGERFSQRGGLVLKKITI